MPLKEKNADLWFWDTVHLDPYLVCRYANTTSTVTLHVLGAQTCLASTKPVQVLCTNTPSPDE